MSMIWGVSCCVEGGTGRFSRCVIIYVSNIQQPFHSSGKRGEHRAGMLGAESKLAQPPLLAAGSVGKMIKGDSRRRCVV